MIKIDTESHLDTESHPETRYRVYSITYAWRRVDPGITINGEKHSRYVAPIIIEYIDMTTGEIIPAAELRGNPEAWPTVYASERALQRQTILNGLRHEVREFAFFVLEFRNQRRGITPGIEKLVEWYAQLHGKRASNVRRYVKLLEEGGVLAGSSLLSPIFQIAGKSTPTKMHLSEDVIASTKFMEMMMVRPPMQPDPVLLAA